MREAQKVSAPGDRKEPGSCGHLTRCSGQKSCPFMAMLRGNRAAATCDYAAAQENSTFSRFDAALTWRSTLRGVSNSGKDVAAFRFL